MIDFKEIDSGENWELFARDFLSELGLTIESDPDRGPDGGKDLLVLDKLQGYLGKYSFRWLISCKHFAKSGKAVGVDDETNILDRMKAVNAEGFLGFYSTLTSSGLNDRLRSLHQNAEIKDYKIYDNKIIENYLIRKGYSHLVLRYFPQSYINIKPLHFIADEYIPLKCKKCSKDLLEAIYSEEQYNGNISMVTKLQRTKSVIKVVEEVYWACKDDCDRTININLGNNGYSTSWEDIGDLAIPSFFLKWIFGLLNNLRDNRIKYTDQAFEQLKHFIFAMSQRVLRESTEKEKKRVIDLIQLEDIFK